MASKKRKQRSNDDDNAVSKKRKVMGRTSIDSSEIDHDTGLCMTTSTSSKGIDYTKWAEQKVVEVEVEGCVHKICYPPSKLNRNGNGKEEVEEDAFADCGNEFTLNFDSLDCDEVKEFCAARPFELDVFQKQSVCAIEAKHNVLVSAHTSAGKTTVAEYAIAKALAHNERVIYTSPIKALSNQKFRQLKEQFLDVGLVTGDTSMNRDASCIVMTTEILRNMLYRGAEIIREISWVIFDEIHYMRDPNRGVVWEETLILLPPQSRFVFLSATIPNSVEFAKWICKINTHPTHVVYTEMRPVPLQHYMFPSGGKGIFLVVDHQSNFKESNFQRALNSMRTNDKGKGKAASSWRKRAKSHSNDIFKLIKMIMEREFDPCIVFAFSRKQVEELALSLSKLDFCSLEEKKLISRIYNNAVSTLKEEDRNLPQIQCLIGLLRRGIGIHHSGLLPILKEIVEILFGEGLIRVLFTTETFAMGVNFPAKTVIFSDIQKWDGTNRRLLTSGEYIQMSGRAGRRGLDERGIVIMMVSDKLEPMELQLMLKGKSDRLVSQFHLTYAMLIRLQRLDAVQPSYLIHRSFMQFQKLEKIPQLTAKLSKLRKEMKAKYQFESAEMEQKVEKYCADRRRLHDLYLEMTKKVNTPRHLLSWLNPGRLLYISQPLLNVRIGWSVCLNFKKISQKDLDTLRRVYRDNTLQIGYIVDVLTLQNKVISVQLHHIERLSGIRLKLGAFKKLSDEADKRKLALVLRECLKRNGDALQELHPVKHLGIKDESVAALYSKIEGLKAKLKTEGDREWKHHDVKALLSKLEKKRELETEKKAVQQEMSKIENNEHIEARLASMARVLRRLQMVDGNVVTLKGKIACEVSCGDELVLTEMLFSNDLNEVASTEHTNALLSCFVFSEPQRSDNGKANQLADRENAKNYDRLKQRAMSVCKVQEESKLEVNAKKYIESFSPGLMDVTLAWSRGASFAEIAKMTKVYEGSVIRVLKRLDELLSELVQCAQIMGNETLVHRFQRGKILLKRDIVFSSSLYL